MVWNVSGGYLDIFGKSHPVDNLVVVYRNDNEKQVNIKLSNLLTKCPLSMVTYGLLSVSHGLDFEGFVPTTKRKNTL